VQLHLDPVVLKVESVVSCSLRPTESVESTRASLERVVVEHEAVVWVLLCRSSISHYKIKKIHEVGVDVKRSFRAIRLSPIGHLLAGVVDVVVLHQ